jgi:hypothetical protein
MLIAGWRRGVLTDCVRGGLVRGRMAILARATAVLEGVYGSAAARASVGTFYASFCLVMVLAALRGLKGALEYRFQVAIQ